MNNTAHIEGLTVTREVHVNASRSTVWVVLTDPAHLAEWFGQTATFPDGVREGAVGTFGWTEHGEFPARVDTFEPEDSFAFTWGTPGEEIRPDNSTTAHFTLDDDENGTRLTVTERGFENLGDEAVQRSAMEGNRQGWNDELDELVAYAESLA